MIITKEGKGMDWKRKLASRKLWAAVAGFAAALLTAENLNAAVGILGTYIIGEGIADACRCLGGRKEAGGYDG